MKKIGPILLIALTVTAILLGVYSLKLKKKVSKQSAHIATLSSDVDFYTDTINQLSDEYQDEIIQECELFTKKVLMHKFQMEKSRHNKNDVCKKVINLPEHLKNPQKRYTVDYTTGFNVLVERIPYQAIEEKSTVKSEKVAEIQKTYSIPE